MDAKRVRKALEKRERELEALASVAARVHGEDDDTAILDIALEEILSRLELPAGWVFMGDGLEQRLRLVAHRGLGPAYLERIERDGLDRCLCHEVLASGLRMQARNTTDCPRMPEIVAPRGNASTHACIPLQFDGSTRGVLNIAARPGSRFSASELRFLDTLGHQVCLAIEKARHLRAERLRNQEARALAAINKAIGGSLDASAVLRAVGETAREILGVDRVQIFLGDDPRHLTVSHLSGLPHPDLREHQTLDLIEMGATLLTQCVRERSVFSVADWTTDARVNQRLAERWGSASGIVVPLLARERLLGLLVLTRTTRHQWTAEHVDVAETLAVQASLALENVRLYEEARSSYQELKAAQATMIRNEKMAVLGTFASGLAHEVRNPLNSIALQLSLLERRTAALEQPLSEQIHDVADIIRQEVKRLDGLVSDFLLFSRTNTIQYKPANLELLLDEVVRLLRPEARAAGVTLRRQRMGEATPRVPMDAEKMKQVIINLVRNAIEAMPEGGNVIVEEGLVDGRACMAVRDSGPGLPDGLDVFQLFVTTKPRGTGLGLSIAQQIVVEHAGEITVASAPGQGTSFTVSLPVRTRSDSAQEDEVHDGQG
jgi:signal transduction histidine kinase